MKFAVAILAAIMAVPSMVSAQVRVLSRTAESVTVYIEPGARMRHVEHVVGFAPDMDRIAESNPGHIIYVCHDQLSGERPSMSRSAAFYATCIDFPRERWFVAGVTYSVPIMDAAAEPEPAHEIRFTHDPDDEANIASLERRLAEATTELEEARETEIGLRGRVAELENEADGALAVNLVLVAIIFLLIGLIAYLFYRFRQQLRRIMEHVRRERDAWSRYAGLLRRQKAELMEKLADIAGVNVELQKKLGHATSQVGMLTRGITETSNELTRSLAQQGRLRKRIKTYFVQLRENRNLLIAASTLIQEFQRQRQEDDDRRTRIPHLLKTVDEGRRQWIIASAARNKIIMIEKWRKEVDAVDYPEILFDTYDRMIADYREIELQADAPVEAGIAARQQVIEDFYALTGLRTDSVDPEGRLKASIEAADKNAELLKAQSEALTDLIRLHTNQMAEFHARDEAIKSREAEVAAAEGDLVRRMKEFDARVERWERTHEQKSDVAAWTGGLAQLEVGRVSGIEARLAELEGRVNGFERRAVSAERELAETNAFLEEARKEFRRSKELLEGIKKGPNFLETRVVQMAEYIKQLEDKLGITRVSVFGGLPEIEYGSIPPKNKA